MSSHTDFSPVSVYFAAPLTRVFVHWYWFCLTASFLSAASASQISSILRSHPLLLYCAFLLHFILCFLYNSWQTFCTTPNIISQNHCGTSCMRVFSWVSVCFQSACSFPGNWKGPSWAVISVFLSPSQPKVTLWGTKRCWAGLYTERETHTHHTRQQTHMLFHRECTQSGQIDVIYRYIGERTAAGISKGCR